MTKEEIVFEIDKLESKLSVLREHLATIKEEEEDALASNGEVRHLFSLYTGNKTFMSDETGSIHVHKGADAPPKVPYSHGTSGISTENRQLGEWLLENQDKWSLLEGDTWGDLTAWGIENDHNGVWKPVGGYVE